MRVHDLLFRSAAEAPEATALITLKQRCTYGELASLTSAVARGLAAHGVQRGDRVVIAIDNSAEFVATYFGTMAAGAAAVPMPGGAVICAFYCDGLPEHKVPVRMVFMEELPKDDNGKVNKPALRASGSASAGIPS